MNNELSTVSLEQTEISAGDHTSEQVPPLFVVGVWRSGTTLLYALLNQHPDIRLFYESDIAMLWPMFRLPWRRRAWAEKWEYWNAGASRHDLDPRSLGSSVTSLAEAVELAGRQYCSEKGAKIWGCKSPSYYDSMEFLAREFPGARFIVIWRDPEEICSSIVQASASGGWFARRGMTHRALLACRALKTQCDKLVSMGVPLHQTHYRELVDHTSDTMRGICEFLKIPFTPEVTVLDGADRSAVFEGAHHTLAKGTQIVSRKEPKKPLPAELTGKIRRYKALWKEEVGDDWLLCRYFREIGETKPGIKEQVKDYLWFKLLRFRDVAPGLLFAALPTWVWRAHRRLKYKDAEYLHHRMTKKHAVSRQ